HEDCAAAARDAAHLLESLGHTVEEAHPAALDDPEVCQRFTLVVAAWIARDLDYWSERTGRPLGPDDIEPMNWAVAEQRRACSARPGTGARSCSSVSLPSSRRRGRGRAAGLRCTGEESLDRDSAVRRHESSSPG